MPTKETYRGRLAIAAVYIPHVVVLCCVAVTILMLARTAGPVPTQWPSHLWPQTLILFLCTGGAALAVAIASLFFRLRVELLLSLLSLVIIAIFCGPAATSIVIYFLISSLCFSRLLLSPFPALDDLPVCLQLAVGWAAYAILFSALSHLRMHVAAVHTAILALPIVVVTTVPMLRSASLSRIRGALLVTRAAPLTAPLYMTGLVTCLVVLTFHLAEVALPERYWDALVTHLYVPSFIVGHSEWSHDVGNYAFAYMPMAVDFLYAQMFMLQGEHAARLLNFAAFILTCVTVYEMASRCSSRTAAVWSVVLLISLPVALIESASLFVEHSVALFISSAVLAIVVSGFRVSLMVHTVVMITLAAATASKLHGAFGAVIIGTASTVLYLRHRRAMPEIVRFVAVTVVGGSAALWPYLLAWKNTGNPVFPFLNHVFKSPYYPIENFTDARWTGHLSPLMLFDATFHSSKFLEATDGALGFALFVFLPAGLVAAVLRRNVSVIFSVCVGLLAIGGISLSIQYLRYLYIFVPLLMLGVALAIDSMGKVGWLRFPTAAVAIVVTLLNVGEFPTAGWIIGTSNFNAIFDDDARRALVLDQVPERIANETINQIAGPTSKVLYFANPFGALLTGTAIYDNWYNTTYRDQILRIASEADVGEIVRQIQPTFVIFDSSKVHEAAVGGRYAIIASYLAHEAALLTQIGKLRLYQVARAAEPATAD